MYAHLSYPVLAAALATAVACSAIAAEDPASPRLGEVMQSEPPADGLVTAKNKPAVHLSKQQRQAVINAVVARNSHQATPKEFKAEIGATVPRFIDLHAMPPSLIRDIPALRQYMYAHLDRRIVIVDALAKKVTALIPLPASLTYEMNRRLTAEEAVGGLTRVAPKQLRSLYQSANAVAQAVPQQPLLVGSDLPKGITFHPLPTGIASQTPQLRHLQYAMLQDGRMLLIDPNSRKLAGIITRDEGMAKAEAEPGGAATTGQTNRAGNDGVAGPTSADPLRAREESGKPSAYTGPTTTGPNTK